MHELCVREEYFEYNTTPAELLEVLNKQGWNLGSGHESIRIEKVNSNLYRWIGETYNGGPIQKVDFNFIP